jgi:23S rRNA pseudouridine2457 synthase
VEHVPDHAALHRLAEGSIALDGKAVHPAGVRLLDGDPDLPPRTVPIRFRKSIPTAWLELTLYEGRNRQVRRMTAAVGHPTLRLVRTRIASLTLEELVPGKWRALSREESARFYEEIVKKRYFLPRGGGGIAG